MKTKSGMDIAWGKATALAIAFFFGWVANVEWIHWERILKKENAAGTNQPHRPFGTDSRSAPATERDNTMKVVDNFLYGNVVE